MAGTHDVVVVGAGAAGQTAAGGLARLGLHVAPVEARLLSPSARVWARGPAAARARLG